MNNYVYFNIVMDGNIKNIKNISEDIKELSKKENIIIDIEINNSTILELYYILNSFNYDNIKITLSIDSIEQFKLINSLKLKKFNIVNISILINYQKNINTIFKLNSLLNNYKYANMLYIDIFFEKSDIYKNSTKIIKIYKTLNLLNIKLGITITNLNRGDLIKFKYLENNLIKLKNYINHQLNIFNISKTCIPNAFVFFLSTGSLYTSCGIDKNKIKNINEYLNKEYHCNNELCSIGDAINKEYNYNTFYKGK